MILHIEKFGAGEPIVFLHTGLQTSLTDFEVQREYFRKSFQVILPDLRGHGKSNTNDVSNFFEDSAKDLFETLEKDQIDSAHVVGASLGALVGIFFAKRFPDKVKSLTISGVMTEKPGNWLQMHQKEIAFQTRLLENEQAVNHFNELHKGDWRQFLYMGRNETWYPFQETKDLSGIHSPVLFIAGEGNPNETKGAISYPAMNKNVHVAIIPFASHLVHSEQPELYTKVLHLFLSNIKNSEMQNP